MNSNLDEVAERLVDVLGHLPVLHIFEKSPVDAWANTEGVYITRGMIRLATIDELAFVIAHEIVHVDDDHAGKTVESYNQLNATTLASLKKTKGFFSKLIKTVVIMGAAEIAISAERRQQEYVADRKAQEILKEAGFDPYAGISLFRKLGAHSGGGIFGSHPETSERIKRMRNFR